MTEENKWHGILRTLPELELSARDTALIVVDVQYLDAHRDYGMGAEAKRRGTTGNYEYFFDRIENLMIPNIQRMQRACRERGVEVIFIRIASLVKDGRDVSPEHKRLNLIAPAGSKEAEILEEIKPLDNEVVVDKGCSGVFNGSNFDNILNNMGIKNLIFCGVATNYCVETSVRDAGDRDFNSILLSDACATFTPEQDRMACEIMDECYCKVKTTDEVLELIERLAPAPARAGV